MSKLERKRKKERRRRREREILFAARMLDAELARIFLK
jgi:hypothetical protein